jgi:hypothetical protein
MTLAGLTRQHLGRALPERRVLDRTEALTEDRRRYAATDGQVQRRQNAQGVVTKGIGHDAGPVDDEEVRLVDRLEKRGGVGDAPTVNHRLQPE